MTISHIFPPESTSIPLSEVRAIELVATSVFPPLAISLIGGLVIIGIWWFFGDWSWPITLPSPYASVMSWAVLAVVLGLATIVYAFLFARLKIVTTNHHRLLAVYMVPRGSGERFVNYLRLMMRSTKDESSERGKSSSSVP